uniref:C2 tensin-type domain-containing protein n=1 Tax=Octactis speculum TaxID=3111310 RepID=A0A7S2DLN8_9STRA
MIPRVGIRTFSPHFKIKTCGTTYSSYHDSWSSQKLNKQDRIIHLPNLPVMDEVSIIFYHSSTKRGKLFNFVFHTSFVDKEDDDGHVTLTLGRRKIDGACKSRVFNPCFEVEVWMTADPNFMQDSAPTRQSIHPKLSPITMALTSNRQGFHSTKAESASREAEVTNATIPVSDKSTGLHDSKS